MRFEKALSVTINYIIYAEFDMIVLVINSSRQIIVTFSISPMASVKKLFSPSTHCFSDLIRRRMMKKLQSCS